MAPIITIKPAKTYPKNIEDVFNPIAYDPSFVEKPVPLSEESRLLAEDQKLYVCTQQILADAKKNIPLFRTEAFLKEDPVVIARCIRHWLVCTINYDDDHEFSSIRTAQMPRMKTNKGIALKKTCSTPHCYQNVIFLSPGI